jgi:hypothetical protein
MEKMPEFLSSYAQSTETVTATGTHIFRYFTPLLVQFFCLYHQSIQRCKKR